MSYLLRYHPWLTGFMIGLLLVGVAIGVWDRIDPGPEVIRLEMKGK